METNDDFLIRLLKTASNESPFGFDFDIKQIVQLFEQFLQQYGEASLSPKSSGQTLQLLSQISHDVEFSNVDMFSMRWFDVNSSVHNTDNLASSFIPSLPTSAPTKAMILCQAPLYELMEGFLENQIERNIQTFVVLETIEDIHIDDQIECQKYYPYWAGEENQEKRFGKMVVQTTLIEKYTNINLIRVTITNLNTNHIHHAKIIHYLAWPDKSVVSIDELHNLVSIIQLNTNGETQLLIHCSGGIGRAGTLSCSLIVSNLTKKELDLIRTDELVLLMKILRPGTIQNKLQYQLLIDYVEFLKKLT
jgi:protein tyrosine phosphatase